MGAGVNDLILMYVAELETYDIIWDIKYRGFLLDLTAISRDTVGWNHSAKAISEFVTQALGGNKCLVF